jgi:hypothetical protein
MISEKQLAANQRNAEAVYGSGLIPATATEGVNLVVGGPKTEAGKQRSSLNATRHAITGQVTVMTDEDRAAFTTFSARMLKTLAPEGELEIQLAQRLVKDTWRLHRLSAIEDNLFALGHSENSNDIDAEHPEAHAALIAAHSFTQQSHQLQLLSLYEQRLNRAHQKNLAIYQSLQADRKAQQAKELEEAALLLQLSEIEGIAWEPSQDGFVFSLAQITAAIDRSHRLQAARAALETPPSSPRKPLAHARVA